MSYAAKIEVIRLSEENLELRKWLGTVAMAVLQQDWLTVREEFDGVPIDFVGGEPCIPDVPSVHKRMSRARISAEMGAARLTEQAEAAHD
jgi:hypothetical protein